MAHLCQTAFLSYGRRWSGEEIGAKRTKAEADEASCKSWEKDGVGSPLLKRVLVTIQARGSRLVVACTV